MFMETIAGIKSEIVKWLFVVQLVSKEEEEEKIQSLKSSLEQNNDDIELLSASSPQPAKIEKKIARNEPCPCGSGKKYKQCCGKSGPKRGMVANT